MTGYRSATAARRALARATLTTALAGVAVGVLAVAFLAMSDGRLDATSVPVVALLVLGQVAGLAAAAACALPLRAARSPSSPGQARALTAARWLDALARLVVAAGMLTAAVPVVLLEPRGAAALSAVLGLGVLAQVVVAILMSASALRRSSGTSRAGKSASSRWAGTGGENT